MSMLPSHESGSSPLTRGKPRAPVGQALAPRLIPAHAGKTIFVLIPFVSKEAHPRSRGENYRGALLTGNDGGSSPLTRGKLRGVRLCYVEERLIPAHAGKTRGQLIVLRRSGAHPRSRGENMP